MHSLRCFRWRNSFLFSLVFGIPVMIVMIYGMVSMAAATCPADDVDVTTAAMVVMTTAAESSENCGSHSVMLLPGLSLENLLLFLLCTPCQVCLSMPFICLQRFSLQKSLRIDVCVFCGACFF